MPISIGAAPVATLGQEDIENPASPICICPGTPIRIGLAIGFWEPARQVDVTRKPFCLVSLGGISLNPGIPAPEAAQWTRTTGPASSAFYQAHWYVNPMLYWLEVLLDFACLEHGGFDLAYLTEVDPLWKDDELTVIINPDAILFANPLAIAACAADCVAASVGFGLAPLFWCAGCQGGLYPMDGYLPTHIGGVQSSMLITQRLTSKMHRQLIAWALPRRRGIVRTVPRAGDGQARLQDADDLPDSQYDQDQRDVLSTFRPHHHPVGRGQGVPGPRRGLLVPALPEEKLLCLLRRSWPFVRSR